MTDGAIILNETIHQATRLRIMSILVSQPDPDRLAYGFIRSTLNLTGGNLTTHLRKLESAGYLAITKEAYLAITKDAHNSRPRTWVTATPEGRRAFADYLSNLEKALNLRLQP